MNTIPTNKGNLSVSEIINELQYASYKANRGYGMTHENSVRIGLGNDAFKKRYEAELTEDLLSELQKD